MSGRNIPQNGWIDNKEALFEKRRELRESPYGAHFLRVAVDLYKVFLSVMKRVPMEFSADNKRRLFILRIYKVI